MVVFSWIYTFFFTLIYITYKFSTTCTTKNYGQEMWGNRGRECSRGPSCAQGQAPHWPWPKWWRPPGPAPGAPCSQCPAPGRTQHPRQPGSSLRWSWWWWLSEEGLQESLRACPHTIPTDTPRTPKEGRKRAKEVEEYQRCDRRFMYKSVYCNKPNFLKKRLKSITNFHLIKNHAVIWKITF